jgi:predicted transcriptional regulator
MAPKMTREERAALDARVEGHWRSKMSLGEIAKKEGLSRSTVQSMVKRLVERGTLKRKPGSGMWKKQFWTTRYVFRLGRIIRTVCSPPSPFSYRKAIVRLAIRHPF